MGQQKEPAWKEPEHTRTTERRKRGDAAESLVAEQLVREGYEIRDRNLMSRYGEIDIIAQRGRVLVFVEVRMRTTDAWGDPALTVSASKQRKVVRTAAEYVQRYRLRNFELRFDVASVVGRGRDAHVELIPNAFDASCCLSSSSGWLC